MHHLFIQDIDYLTHVKHRFPHQFLGLHIDVDQEKIIRLWRPRNERCFIRLFGKEIAMELTHPAGLFTLKVPKETTYKDYEVQMPAGKWHYDPYAFCCSFGTLDAYLFNQGVHYQIYNVLGAHLVNHEGVQGVKFALWAPSAEAVSLVGDFNHWDDATFPMRLEGNSGVWELFVPGLELGEKYKFSIRQANGQYAYKIDPYANAFELRPRTAAIVTDVNRFCWRDQEWMNKRARTSPVQGPMNIYELHLGSWMQKDAKFFNYREIASELVHFCKEMHFTHVEILPITEHPLDDSWGYQTTGYYAVTSRYGSCEDFQYFVNHLHMHDIGVIIDWSPSHFPKDEFALARFDGTTLYEYGDPRIGEHPEWNTLVFDYWKNEVKNFLIGSAFFWIEKMHIDGIRVDAVASMLYRDYSRRHMEWIPNVHGGNENLEAIDFLRHLNSIVHERAPNVLMIAEESTHFAGVTAPTAWQGLGFDLKWNMGWMNDTLKFFKRDFSHRSYHHDDITFGLVYQYSERFLLPLSHDEVVHQKHSLLSKMPGDEWQKFANLRLLYAYSLAHPGKNLFFMGAEIGQKGEWNFRHSLDWHLLNDPMHRKHFSFVKAANAVYKQNSAFWEWDFEQRGFDWVNFQDYDNSVISFMRHSNLQHILCVCNFRERQIDEYYLPLQRVKKIQELFNSDHIAYGGSGKLNEQIFIEKDYHGASTGVRFSVPSFGVLFFEVEFC
ncbi:MAG: 1,4-alpha-glucan branching protein GlgB [Chlamydiae bacterium]|nr:1,4-alpha-glucan branching protein GlgB [Chlamydiota bacterium]